MKSDKQKKAFKIYSKGLKKLIYIVLEKERPSDKLFDDIEFTKNRCAEMINSVTNFYSKKKTEELNNQTIIDANNIIAEYLLDMSTKIDGFIPDEDKVGKCAVIIAKLNYKISNL